MGRRTEAPAALTADQAMAEASRCLFCFEAPCSGACPSGVDVAGFIRRIRTGNFTGAHRLIWEANVLGGVCGRVCPTQHLCEEACSYTELARPIEIGALQAFACGFPLAEGGPGKRRTGPRVAVIGAGPAGLAAAAELVRRGYRPTVFERGPEAGGQARWAILEPKLPRGVLESEVGHLKSLGVTFRYNRRSSQSLGAQGLRRQGFKAVFLGLGLPGDYRLDIPGVECEGVGWGRDLLRRLAGARTAAERRSIRPGRRVVVVGGGNVAVDTATAARRLGARKVLVVSLEGPTEMPAYPSEIQSAWSMGVEFRTRSRLTDIEGGARGRVRGVRGVEIDWTTPGRFVPSNAVDVPGTEFALPADRVYLAVGQCPDLRIPDLWGAAVDRRGLIKVNRRTGQTSVPGIFAGGDAVSGGATVVQAIAEGKRAAAGIDRYLARGKGGRRSRA